MLMTGNRLYGNSLRVPRIDKERERERGADYLARARFDCLVSARARCLCERYKCLQMLPNLFISFCVCVFREFRVSAKLKKKEFGQSMYEMNKRRKHQKKLIKNRRIRAAAKN
jgi:hypothetical protein